jgi:hypothetical protein
MNMVFFFLVEENGKLISITLLPLQLETFRLRIRKIISGCDFF